MMNKHWLSLVLAVGLGATAAPAWSQSAALDELLDQVRRDAQQETQINAEREREFRQQRNRQRELLQQAEAELRAAERRSEQLQEQFDANERRLSELETTRQQRLGDLGEAFGVVRQVAGDTAGLFENSLVTAQVGSERIAFLEGLTERQRLPSVDQLERLWYELLRETKASGEVRSFQHTVILPNGERAEREVVRIGAFNALADGRYLTLNENTELEELARQPAGRYLSVADDFAQAEGEVAPMPVDPTRGQILRVLVDAPTLQERIQQGGVIGYVIIALGILGLILVIERLIVLNAVSSSMRRQLKRSKPSTKNPLGRVLSVYHNDPNMDVETLELKLDEAILKETPRLDRGLQLIRLIAAIAPLLGLLGTVTGMIRTFQAITLFGTGDPKLMAGGISQALVTTVLGLTVAIPMALLHRVLASQSRDLTQILEEESAGIIAKHAELIHENPQVANMKASIKKVVSQHVERVVNQAMEKNRGSAS